MKILQIASKVPYPVTDGGRGGIYNITKQFLRCGAEVHFAAPRTNSNDLDGFERMVTLHLLDVDPASKALGALKNLAKSQPYNIAKYYSVAAMRQLEEIVRQHHFDIVHVDSLHMAAYGIGLKAACNIPVSLREHNVESELMRRFTETTEKLSLRVYSGLQLPKLVHYEGAVIQQFDMVVPISEIDEGKLRQLAPSFKSTVIPAGVDTGNLRAREGDTSSNVLLFTNYDWLPNRDSLQFYMQKILPELKRIKPDVKTVIVGRETDRLRRTKGLDGIEIRGFVPDLNEISRDAVVAVIPLRIGSGMRIKILELMALGMAIVSTSLGAEGIKVTNGENIVIADEPAAFARAVATLLGSPQECARLGSNARSLVEESYSWDSVGDRFHACYSGLINRR